MTGSNTRSTLMCLLPTVYFISSHYQPVRANIARLWLIKYSASLRTLRDLDSSGILISSLSDHYPCFALLDICKKKKHKPKFITINNKNEQALASFCTEVETSLNKWQINNDLMTDPNENYNIFEKIILDAKTKHLSPKSVWFKKYKHRSRHGLTTIFWDP